MSDLQQLNPSPLYWLPDEPLAEDVLIPGFQAAERVACMVGFFTSSVLAELAPGLAAYIENTNESFRLIISPHLNPDDLEAISTGIQSAEDIISNRLGEALVTQDMLEQHTLRCLSFLIQKRRMEIKVAVMRDGLFHPKVWLFQQDEHVLAVHGSSNMTYAGIRQNIEQISVSQSWADTNQQDIAKKLRDRFECFWDDAHTGCSVISIPEAVKKNIVNCYPVDNPPSLAEFRTLVSETADTNDASEDVIDIGAPLKPIFKIPEWLAFDKGPFEHQGKAVSAWCNEGFRGVLEMATGSGKTIAAMICAFRLYEKHQPLLIVVAAPFKPLIQQWCREIVDFGLKPVDLTEANGEKARATSLNRIRRQLKHEVDGVAVVVMSHKTLCKSSMKSELSKFHCTKLLIADEAHNLGSEGFISDPPSFFENRLALSATPVRQYDQEGTEALFAFFGPVVFRFTLKEAIGACLVEYDYYIHEVSLTKDEMDRWYELTMEIKSNSWRQEKGKPDTYLSKLLNDRRLLLEAAENKIPALESALAKENRKSLKHTLIYATDKAPSQLKSVNKCLNRNNITFNQLTHKETSDKRKVEDIINSFQEGTIQVLTAMRVLDEGVNIPQVSKAFILASTTVERQWIQRRGRILRTCKEIGKTHSEIHDFVVVPPITQGIDDSARKLVKSELRRIEEFARHARNAGREDGPLEVIDSLVKKAFL